MKYCHVDDGLVWSPRDLPGHYGGVAENFQNSSPEAILAAGWRVAVFAPVEEGARISSTVVFTDTEAHQVATVLATAAQVAAEGAAADFQANAERYAWGNAFLLMCDKVTGSTSHAKISFEALPSILLAIKATNRNLYEDTRDAFDLINSACLKKFGLEWWDSVTWIEHPAIIAGANQILAGVGAV